jgi:hypothetical protein
MPLDIVLTRYQTAHSMGKNYASPYECAVQLLASGGPTAFFRGWGPMFIRMLPSSVVTFLLYENIRKLAGLEFS